MPSITSLVAKLQTDHTTLIFATGESFHWSPGKRTVYYIIDSSDAASLLHETAHAILGHSDYRRDIELIGLERDAWQYAADVLAPRYRVAIDDEAIQASLDTYRSWLHERSRCPSCESTGIQTGRSTYRCLACGQSWRVNEARLCALRRYKL